MGIRARALSMLHERRAQEGAWAPEVMFKLARAVIRFEESSHSRERESETAGVGDGGSRRRRESQSL
jgi:hypothetical protein